MKSKWGSKTMMKDPYEEDFELQDGHQAVAIFESGGQLDVGVSQKKADQTPVKILGEELVKRSLFHLSGGAGDVGVRIAGKGGETVRALIIIFKYTRLDRGWP
jgi:hypothetical protein